jgi:NAD(P)-dependent dehydrogenase (short-subunit alcohol dehydrogenase family)
MLLGLCYLSAMAFHGKVAIVTGGASGIGLAMSRRLTELGATVIVADINREAGEAAAASLGAEFLLVDVADLASVKALIAETAERHGRIDYLFNNAGIAIVGSVRDTPVKDWYRVFDINVRGVVHGIDAVYPLFIKQGFGHIVNTASIAGLIPCPGLVAYSASKHAVVGLSTGLRVEAAKHGVKVSVVCPGFVRTPILENASVNGRSLEAAKKKIPWADPDEVARDILSGVERNKPVIVVTRHGKVLTQLHRLAPSALHWASARLR